VPRPRAFDDTVALDACVEEFWDHGYRGTSTDELCERAGLSRSSLYNAFGKKRDVYLRGVRRYGERLREERAAVVASQDGETGRDALRTFVTAVLDPQWRDPERRVCFGIHACVEVGSADEDVRAVLLGNADQYRSVLADLIRRGQRDRSLHRRGDPEDLAAVLHAALDGLQVAACVRSDRAEIDRVADTLLALL
jgi:TetR/AcrR family transcriptional regulator, transcriptional repressor for nem operon